MHFDKIDSRQIGYKKTWIFKSTSLLEHVLGDALVQKIRLVVLSFERFEPVPLDFQLAHFNLYDKR